MPSPVSASKKYRRLTSTASSSGSSLGPRLAAEPGDERADAPGGHPGARVFLGGSRLCDLGAVYLWDAQREVNVDLSTHVFPDVGDDVERASQARLA